MLRNALHQMQVLDLVPGNALTASGTGSAIDLKEYEGPLAMVLDYSAGGAGATLDAKLTHSDTSGGTYTDVTNGAFTQVGNAAAVQKVVVNSDEIKQFVKISYTIAGTASFKGGIKGFAIKKTPA